MGADVSKKPKSTTGFTLTELLASVMIIGILGSLVVSSVNKARFSAENIKCVSNLHQIGLGILSYAQDHESTLPGPLLIGIYAWSWHDDPAALTTIIWNYTDVDKTVAVKKREDVFVCPAYGALIRRKFRGDYSAFPGYVLNAQVPMLNDTLRHQPFGYPGMQIRYLGQPVQETAPMRLNALPNIGDVDGQKNASTVWALKDADALDSMAQALGSPAANLPKQMIHGQHRNALFFDFHVGAIDAHDEPF